MLVINLRSSVSFWGFMVITLCQSRWATEDGAKLMTDEDALARARQGDETAFLLVYERHRDAVFRFAYRLIGSVESAEDVTHDCFLSLITDASRYDPERAALRTYLFAAVRNLALKHYRENSRELDIEQLDSEPSLPDSMQPIHLLLREELSAEVRQAIGSLPPLQREALVLFEYEEMSLADIAIIVAADVGTIKSRLYRAREHLRERLQPYWKSDAGLLIMKKP